MRLTQLRLMEREQPRDLGYGQPEVIKPGSHSWGVAWFAARATAGLSLHLNGGGHQDRDCGQLTSEEAQSEGGKIDPGWVDNHAESSWQDGLGSTRARLPGASLRPGPRPHHPVTLLRMPIERSSLGVGVRECAGEFGPDHERGTVVEATPIPFVPASCSATSGPGAVDPAELAAQLGLPSGVLSCVQRGVVPPGGSEPRSMSSPGNLFSMSARRSRMPLRLP